MTPQSIKKEAISDMTLISLQNFSFTYNQNEKPTLQDINLDIQQGEKILLTGSTGCGKTTLLRSMGGFIPHLTNGKIKGDIFLQKQSTKKMKMSEICRQVGMVFQEPDSQLFHYRVEDEIAFGLENIGIPSAEIDKRIEESLIQVDMQEARFQVIEKLSGGEKQRIALASILAMKPSLLLLDEPTSQLDPKARKTLIQLLTRLHETTSLTMIICSHHLQEWLPLCDRLVLMEHNKIALDRGIPDVFEDLTLFQDSGVEIPLSIQLSLQYDITPFARSLVDFRGKFSLSKLLEITKTMKTPKPQMKKTDTNILSIEKVSFRYHRREKEILNELSLTINQGECVALMGANGCGKSTLLSLIAGLYKPQKGTLSLQKNIKKKQQVGFLLQEPSLMLQSATIYEELDFFPQQIGLSLDERQKNVNSVAHLLELDKLMQYVPFALSRGQQQRLVLGSLLTAPLRLLLLDEPTTGQDQHHLEKLFQVIFQILEKQNAACLFSTHDPELALWVADRLIIMDDGKIVASGSPKEIFEGSKKSYLEMPALYEIFQNELSL